MNKFTADEQVWVVDRGSHWDDSLSVFPATYKKLDGTMHKIHSNLSKDKLDYLWYEDADVFKNKEEAYCIVIKEYESRIYEMTSDLAKLRKEIQKHPL